MHIQILTDLHLEFGERDIPPLAKDSDLVILAGDIAPACTRRIADLAGSDGPAARHILYVPGNHEYYGSDIEDARARARGRCAGATA